MHIFLCDIMQPIARTKDNIVKKQALTYEEIEAEREEVRRYLCFLSFLSRIKNPYQNMACHRVRSVSYFFNSYSKFCLANSFAGRDTS